jgi:23S rRNA (uracil1939-C5)-methyltransferase
LRRLLGYYERGTHRVVDVAECPVAAPAVEERLSRLRQALREGRLPEDAHEFEAVEGDRGVSLTPPVEPEDEGEQTRTIAGEHYRFGAGCFFQINHALLDALVRAGLGEAEGEAAVDAAGDTARDAAGEAAGGVAGDTALDLYSGVGLFTLPLARRFARVVAVEANAAAADYARRNLAAAALTNARVETSSVGDWLKENAQGPESAQHLRHVDFVLLDPPRAGADADAVRAIIALAPRHISYVSCDPATLSRDLRAFNEAGYRLASVRAFDMFPQTHHVETVVHLLDDSQPLV